MPTAGLDYPASDTAFAAWFVDEDACWDYLEWLRWGDGYRCPRCAARKGWRLEVGRFECSRCGLQSSVTAGTIFDKTRTPLRLWFQAAWLMTSQKNGVSALGVQRALGLGSYQTAWAMLHRFRAAMVRPGRERLDGHVEADETYVGGVEEGTRGRETQTKSIVAIAVEIENPKGFGRVRMRCVPDVSQQSLVGFIDDVVSPGATIHTDGWPAYLALTEHGYLHERTVISAQSDPAHVVMPGVHRIASLLKRWLLGTHQGKVSPTHLDAYLNEFTFRFNRRRSRRRGLLFYRLLEQAVLAEPIRYRSLIAAPGTRQRPAPDHIEHRGQGTRLPVADRPWRQGTTNATLPK